MHHLNEYYRYPCSREKFKLIEVNGWVYHFEGGHWCTDNVFMDLIRVKTGVQVYQDTQTQLF